MRVGTTPRPTAVACADRMMLSQAGSRMLRRSAPPRTPARDEHRRRESFAHAARIARARGQRRAGTRARERRGDRALPPGRPRRRRPRAALQAARWAPSPALGRAEILWAVLGGIALAVLTSWPLVLHLPSRISPDLGDPVRTAWEVAWVGHAMLHDPLHFFDANVFYPHPLSLAFSDSLLGYGPAAFFGSGTVAALVRYNLLFLFAWSLCFVGAYLLARELGLGRLGGAVAGVGVRLRALPRDRGRAPARDLLRRHPAGVVLAPARLPASLEPARARGLARVGLADQPRLHARPAVQLSARRPCPARALALVARAVRAPIPCRLAACSP